MSTFVDKTPFVFVIFWGWIFFIPGVVIEYGGDPLGLCGGTGGLGISIQTPGLLVGDLCFFFFFFFWL